jgi:hypothetical protein
MSGEVSDLGRRQSHRSQAVLLMARLVGTTFDTICVVQDVSPFGAKIKTGMALAEQDLVTLQIGQDFEIPAVVRWRRGEFVGLSFGKKLPEVSLVTALAQEKGRRSSQRFRRCANVLVTTPHGELAGELVNLSTTGAGIALEPGKSVAIGTHVTMTIKRFLQRSARVQWTAEAQLGLAFDAPLRLAKMEECLIGWLENCRQCLSPVCPAPSFQLSLTKRADAVAAEDEWSTLPPLGPAQASPDRRPGASR